MAVLQYVGARYVLKFFDDGKGGMEWEGNRYYEALTAVSYRDSTYISRVPVPNTIGAPPENGEYWILMGSFNGWIKQLQEDMIAVKSDISELQSESGATETEVDSLRTSLTTVTAQVESLDGEMVALTGQVTSLDNELDSVDAKVESIANFIDIRRFGAVGDGVADDTAAFSAAMASSQPGAIYVPAGSYKISELTITRSIYGAGTGAKLIISKTVELTASGISLESLYCTGGTSEGTIPLIRLTGDNITVRNCTIENTANIGIAVQGHNNAVRDCVLKSIGCSAKQAGIWMQSEGSLIDHNRLSDIYLDGIGFYKCNSCVITNNVITGCGKHPPYPSAYGACGIFCGDDGTSCIIRGNMVTDCSEGGIVVGLQYYGLITDNIVSRCGLFGIVGLFTTSSISNNSVFINGGKKEESSIAYAGYGIVVRSGNNIAITGNSCPNSDTQSAIMLGAEESISDSVISGNRFGAEINFPNTPRNVTYTGLNN